MIETYQLGTLLALETVAVNCCSITGDVSLTSIGAFPRVRWQSCDDVHNSLPDYLTVAFVAFHGQSCHEDRMPRQ